MIKRNDWKNLTVGHKNAKYKNFSLNHKGRMLTVGLLKMAGILTVNLNKDPWVRHAFGGLGLL